MTTKLTPEAQGAWERLVWAKCPEVPIASTDSGTGNPPVVACLSFCPKCGGTGLRWPQLSKQCGPCSAHRFFLHPERQAGCPDCGGRGRIAVEPTAELLDTLAREAKLRLCRHSDGVVLIERDYPRPHDIVAQSYIQDDGLSASILALAEALLGVKDG